MNSQPKLWRAGFVGAGNITKLHYEGISRHADRVVVAGLCDPDSDPLQARAHQFGCTAVFPDVETMIADGGIDVAVVCTATHVRRPVVLPLLEAGIPVLCEKPFAESYPEAVEIEQAVRQTGVPLAVNQNFRRHFSFHIARDILQNNQLGAPVHLVQNEAWLRRDRGWRLERSRYVMSVMSIHWFDGYRFMLDDEVDHVYCEYLNSPATPGGDDTAVSLLLRFRSGALVCLSDSFSSYTKQNFCALDCERGGLIMDYAALSEIREDGTAVEHANPYDKAEATWCVLADLLDAVEQGREPETSAADNLHTMRVLEAAYRSITENRVIPIEEIS